MTKLDLVGLQVWRVAFLLADFIFSNPEIFKNKNVLELGSGVGFDSIVASMFAKEVICTGKFFLISTMQSSKIKNLIIQVAQKKNLILDVNIGGILKLIERNFQKNQSLIKSKLSVVELNFLNTNWQDTLKDKIDTIDVIMAADGNL